MISEQEARALVEALGPDLVRALLSGAAPDATSHLALPAAGATGGPPSPLYVPSEDVRIDHIAIAHATPLAKNRDLISAIQHQHQNVRKQEHVFRPLPIDYVDWAESNFYIADRIDPISLQPTEEIGLIYFLDFQRTIFRFLFYRHRPLAEFFQNYIISTIKKSGKTAHAAALGRWIAETWGTYTEVLCLGADKEQATDKLYAAITKSIELNPTFDPLTSISYGVALHPDSRPDEPIFMPDYQNPQWRLRANEAQFIPNHGIIKAVPMDPKGIAGGNQVAALFTEMWAFDSRKARRVFDELTPPPTRPRSSRIMEGYAGYEGESGLWEELWEQGRDPDLGARMVTRAELEAYGGWPFPPVPGSFDDNPYEVYRSHPDPIPLYVSPDFRMGSYIDQGEIARRMPWQTPEYYRSQKNDESFDRHHRNVASSHLAEFVSRQLWDACHIRNHPQYVHRPGPPGGWSAGPPSGTPYPSVPEWLRVVPPLDADEPFVLAADGSVDDDTTALMAVSYSTVWDYLDRVLPPEPPHGDPQSEDARLLMERLKKRRLVNENQTMVREYHTWEPSKAHPMNYKRMLVPVILRYFGMAPDPNEDPDGPDPHYLDPGPPPVGSGLPEMNCKLIVYDTFQLHDTMVNLRADYGIWVQAFSQQTGRDTSDRDLFVAIRDRQFWHDGSAKLDRHRQAAAKRIPRAADSSTANRTHIVKKPGSNTGKIDLIVVASMGSFTMKKINA